MRSSLIALFLALPLFATEPEADPWKDVREAFAAAKPIPAGDFAGDELEFYKRLQKIAEGCPASCVSEKPEYRKKAVDGYLKAIERACGVLALEDVAAVQARYCPPGKTCLLSPAAVLRAAKNQEQAAPVQGAAGKEALAGKAAEDLLKRAGGIGFGLQTNKNDNLSIPELEVETANIRVPGDEAELDPEPVPVQAQPQPQAQAQPEPKIGTTVMGIPTSLLDRAVENVLAAFTAERLEKTRKLALAAAALLKREGGDPKAAAALEAALLSGDKDMGDKVRALLSTADRKLEALFEAALTAKLKETRKASCVKHKKESARTKCENKPGTEEELAAARDAVFTANPELGLYLLDRAEYQAFIAKGLADARLAKGTKLEPWEVGRGTLPEGTTVLVDSEEGGKNEKEYSGLRYTRPDGSVLFQGTRTSGKNVEELMTATAADGSAERVTRVTAPAAKGQAPKVVRYESTSVDAQGHKTRWERQEKGVTEAKIFNKNAKDDGDYWHYEKVAVKGKVVHREVHDFNAGTITKINGEQFTVMTSGAKGKPMDPKDKDAGAEGRWKQQSGVLVDGKPQIREVLLADGRALRGGTDPNTGGFAVSEDVDKDGNGYKLSGKVIVILEKGQTKAYQLPLKGLNMADAAAEFVLRTGMNAKRAGPLAGWLTVRGSQECSLMTDQRADEIGVVCGDKVSSQAVFQMGTDFKGASPGVVLHELSAQGVPEKEWLGSGRYRKWVAAWTTTGSKGYVTSNLTDHKHTLLVEYRMEAGKWVTTCKIYRKRVKHPLNIDLPCDDADSKAKASSKRDNSYLSNFVGDLGKTVNDVPGMSTVSKYAGKTFYKTVGQLQDNIGFNTSSDADRQVGWIANTLRGCYGGKASCEADAKERILDNTIPDLQQRIDETIYDEMKKDKNYLDTCTRLGDGCDKWIRQHKITWEMRYDFLRDAYSPQHAANKGGTVAAVLGNVAILGEQTFSSLPIAFFGQGLAAFGNVKHVGVVGRLGSAAMSTYFVGTSVIDGTSNALAFVQAVDDGNFRAAASAFLQAGLDFGYSRLGARDAVRKQAEFQAKAIAKERARLEKLAVERIEVKPVQPEALVVAAPKAEGSGFGAFFKKIIPGKKKPTAPEIQDRAMKAAQEEIAAGEPPGTRVAGVLSSDAVEIQQHKDCGVRAIFNIPDLAPVRDAFFGDYDRFLVFAEKVTGVRLRDKGTSGKHTREILEALGYTISWKTIPPDADGLAALIHENGGMWGNIDYDGKGPVQPGKRDAKKPTHSITVSGAFKENGQWVFVLTDSNYKTPQLYTFDQLKKMDLVTLSSKRAENPETQRPFSDDELTYRAAEVSNDKVAEAAPGPDTFTGRLAAKLWGPRGPPASEVVVRDGSVDTSATGPAADTGLPSKFSTKQKTLERFGGADPLKVLEKGSTTLGGAGGGGAKQIMINGEVWVIKTRRAGAKAMADNQRQAQNEMLGRELIRRFFPDFETPEGLAYQDGDMTVTMTRYQAGRNKDYQRSALDAQQRAALSILHQVFGVGDMNYGNLLTGGAKPMLIDFESISRKPLDSSQIAEIFINMGHAPFVQRGVYNDPAPYKAAAEAWAKKLGEPSFWTGLDEAMKSAGIDGPAREQYRNTVKTNLSNYDKNIGHYLDAVNEKAAAAEVAGSTP